MLDPCQARDTLSRWDHDLTSHNSRARHPERILAIWVLRRNDSRISRKAALHPLRRGYKTRSDEAALLRVRSVHRAMALSRTRASSRRCHKRLAYRAIPGR